MRVAIVHDWLTNTAGAERVVEALCEAFVDADVYTSVVNPKNISQRIMQRKVYYSFLQRLPFAKSRHQLYPMLRTVAFESFDFSQYDVVITSASAESKGIITTTETLHISYIHTPTRYYWGGYQQYMNSPGFGILNPIVRIVLPRVVHKMRRWDYAAAQRADVVLANSQTVQNRIQKYYNRKSSVVFPPVDIVRFNNNSKRTKQYYLVVSRLVAYKRIDLAVLVCTKLNKELVVVGSGAELKKLKSIAGPTITFISDATDAQVDDYYSRAKALLFCGYEDFGITPVEAMAAGVPVICYGKGGVSESVVDGKTGIFFARQTTESLERAIAKFEKRNFDTKAITSRAQEFSKEKFVASIKETVNTSLKEHVKRY